jgi:hypothetical protein
MGVSKAHTIDLYDKERMKKYQENYEAIFGKKKKKKKKIVNNP